MAIEPQYTYSDVQRRLARFNGWPASASDWDEIQTADFAEIVKSGGKRFYYPEGHTWSFMQPTMETAIAPDNRTLEMPDDFVVILGDITYSREEDDFYIPVKKVSEQRIRSLEREVDTTGYPMYYTVRITAASTTTKARQRHELVFHPTPDQAYRIRFRYLLDPPIITSADVYHLGGPEHTRTFVEACLAEAELLLDDDNRGAHMEAFREALAASIRLDHQTSAELIGYNGDASTSSPLGRSQLREDFIFQEQTTYNGVTYS